MTRLLFLATFAGLFRLSGTLLSLFASVFIGATLKRLQFLGREWIGGFVIVQPHVETAFPCKSHNQLDFSS
jgi:hypothetical protein